ncbi:MAG: hypothetical protein RI949_984 [Pseudomonadota bacterium]
MAGVALALTCASMGVVAQSVSTAETEDWTTDPVHRTDVEGAIGLVLKYSPAFPGSSDVSWKASPAGFLRWGRYTVTGAGGFTTQRNREVERGLGAEVARRGALLLNLNVRVDGGRSQSDSPDLAGMGDIPITLRGRLSARWEPVPQWVVTSGVAVDLLRKVGGVNLDAGVQREWLLAPGQRLVLGAGFSAADRTYMQTWHGVTAEQALHASYAPYRASAGLRGLFASATYRYEVDHTWAAFAGVSHSRLVGSAAESPLTRRPEETSWQAGVARRF